MILFSFNEYEQNYWTFSSVRQTSLTVYIKVTFYRLNGLYSETYM